MKTVGIFVRVVCVVLVAVALSGCASIRHYLPLDAALPAERKRGSEISYGTSADRAVVLRRYAGSRVLAWRATRWTAHACRGSVSLLDRVDFVSGVSGGSVTAA